jgi:decaprenyl-phosphate phosphoribosyltransferase
MRPKQWIKNFLLFVAPFSAGIEFGDKTLILFLGFVTFSFAASFGYIVNDLVDFEIDRHHPTKSLRPFASGALSRNSGVLMLTFLTIGIGILFLFLPLKFNLLVIIYVVNTFVYTIHLKKVPVVELFVVASGFVLRLISGAVILDLVVSEWFLIVGGFGALFIVITKRLAELRMENLREVRIVTKSYSVEFLQSSAAISIAVSVSAYAFWAFSHSINPFLYQLTLLPFVMATFRYLWMGDNKNVETPEDAIFSDKILLAFGAIFLLILTMAVY